MRTKRRTITSTVNKVLETATDVFSKVAEMADPERALETVEKAGNSSIKTVRQTRRAIGPQTRAARRVIVRSTTPRSSRTKRRRH